MEMPAKHSTPSGQPSPAPHVAATTSDRLVELDARLLDGAFDRRPFTLRHHLRGHPLFELSSLIALARRLPEDGIEYNAGDIPVSVDPEKTPHNGLSAEETLRRIRECRSWMVLKNVERAPAYQDLLNACLEEVAAAAGDWIAEMRNRQGFIFISSPNAVTPYHIDPEHNFLLQIEGTKTVSIFDPQDRELLSEEALEQFFRGAHRNLEYRDHYQQRAQTFRLVPGTGLHFPVAAPHWVKNGGEVSISFSITFRTPASERREILYKINSVLRKNGIRPSPPGGSPGRDAVKLGVFETLRRTRRALAAARRVRR